MCIRDRMWVEFMTAHHIVEYTPGQATNFVDNTLGQFSAKEDRNKSKKEEREEAARGRDRDRRSDRYNNDRNGNGRNRGGDRDRSRSAARFREPEVGRFPANWRLAVDGQGKDLCISYQLGNCKKSEKDCPDKRIHRCATIIEKTEPLTLCLEDHAAKTCKKRKKE